MYVAREMLVTGALVNRCGLQECKKSYVDAAPPASTFSRPSLVILPCANPNIGDFNMHRS